MSKDLHFDLHPAVVATRFAGQVPSRTRPIHPLDACCGGPYHGTRACACVHVTVCVTVRMCSFQGRGAGIGPKSVMTGRKSLGLLGFITR